MSIRTIFIGALVVLLVSAPARAALPDYVLDRDYQSCLDGDDDAQRVAYCNCIRDGMRGWDENSYMEAANQQASNASAAGAIPAKIADLAKECIAKTLGH